jgi:hypothetical protein
MRTVDLDNFFRNNPRNRKQAILIAQCLKKWSEVVTQGMHVLDVSYFSGYSSIAAYVGVCLSLMVGPKGSVTLFSEERTGHELSRRYPFLTTPGRVRVLTRKDDVDTYLESYPGQAYDIAFVSKEEDCEFIKLSPGGIAVTDWGSSELGLNFEVRRRPAAVAHFLIRHGAGEAGNRINQPQVPARGQRT